MRKISSFMLLLAVILFSACKPTFKKGKDALEYKIISTGNGPKVQYGNFMQFNFATYYNNGKKDSLLNDTRNQSGPIIEMLDSINTPLAYYEILSQLRKGDSAVIRILTDSVFKKNPEQMPPAFKKKHYLTTTLKIMNIFSTREQADSARFAAIQEQQKKDSVKAIGQQLIDDKKITDYLAKNNIKATKAPLGTYVEVIQPGTGNNVDTSSVGLINYTGRTLDGMMFDSNTDPTKGHVEPLAVNFTNDQDPSLGTTVIKGWKDGMSLLNKGAKARLYIPSGLAYGPQDSGGPIGPNSVLIFDIEILDILTKEQAKPIVAAQQKKRQEKQQHLRDSVMKARAADTTNRK